MGTRSRRAKGKLDGGNDDATINLQVCKVVDSKLGSLYLASIPPLNPAVISGPKGVWLPPFIASYIT